MKRLLSAAIASALAALAVNAQTSSTTAGKNSTCLNYGVSDSGSCLCPAGFSGTDCGTPSCGGNAYEPSSNCGCSAGWAGPTCSVCSTSDACNTPLSKYVDPTSSLAMVGMNNTMTCNTGPVVYSAGHVTCKVVQPMLQAFFPGKTELTITRYLNSSSTPGGDTTMKAAKQPSGANVAWAQAWYEGKEQFYCYTSNCNQTVTGNDAAWHCLDLECHCIEGSTFCAGGQGVIAALGPVINSLGGPVDVNCQADGTCTFNQKLLSIIGPEGIPLSGCTFGECVNQYVIDQAHGINVQKSNDGLSGGVIAGLAVVGAIVLAIILVTLWGLWARRKARKAPRGSLYKAGGVGISWHDVGYQVHGHHRGIYGRFIAWFRGFGGSSSRPASPDGERGNANSGVVLQNVCGDLPAGGFCAILGPSGAGKSTLVDILAGKHKTGRVEGKVSYHSASGRRVKVGYCDQSDVLSPTATVLETLLFAAYLRLPENVPKEVKVERAHTVLRQLNLEHIANTRVGSGLQRGISGGEMRRVSIAIELVANPDVLFLDEPTSGLDSVSAARIVNLLKSLTTDPENRTTIIASIHQPSSALYHAFSQVILLSKGRQLYFGPGGNAPAFFFAEQGYACPDGYNVADHLLDIASDPPYGLRSGIGAMASVEKLEWLGSEANGDSELDLAVLNTATPTRTKCATTFLTQLSVLSSREWRNLRRDKTLFLAHFALAVVVGAFAGGLYFKVDTSIAGFQNRVGSLFFLGILIAFSSLSALYNVVEIRPLFLRERSGNFYSAQAWLLSRVIFDIVPLRLIPTIVMGVMIYFMVGLALSAARFFKFLLLLVLYSLAMVLYNFLLGALFTHHSLAILLSSLWTLFNMTFAGFFVNTGKIPAVLGWLHYLAPLHYALEGIVVNEVNSGLHITDTFSGIVIDVSAGMIMETLFGFNLGAYYRDVLVEFAFLAGFGLLLIATVFFFLKEKR